MRRVAFIAVLVSIAALSAHASAHAQGTISGQGFGYPTGQYGARAAGTAGALGPFDSISSVNPAGLAAWQRGVIFFHLEPETRSTKVQGLSSKTRVARFPLVGVAQRVSSKGIVGVTFSTYLDRTWETASTAREVVGTDTVDLTTRYASSGAINDLRLAFAWTFTPRLRLGAAYHAYTGENRLAVGWDFPDTVPFGDVKETSTISYAGNGMSLGTDWAFSRKASVAAYARWGGEARLRTGDTLVSTARMPDHVGIGLRYYGIKGSTFAAAWERVQWSSLSALSSSGISATDADRISAGVETQGPLWHGEHLYLRLGAAHRTLPFATLGHETSETMFAFGVGRLVAKKLGNLDLALQRASRSAGAVTERAWLFTFGLAISP